MSSFSFWNNIYKLRDPVCLIPSFRRRQLEHFLEINDGQCFKRGRQVIVFSQGFSFETTLVTLCINNRQEDAYEALMYLMKALNDADTGGHLLIGSEIQTLRCSDCCCGKSTSQNCQGFSFGLSIIFQLNSLFSNRPALIKIIKI